MAVLVYRDLVRRIRASQKTQQITKTMQMVAASRLKKSQEKFVQSKPYLEGLTEILRHLHNTDVPLVHPLLSARAVKKMALVVVTSDRGLCGTYNMNMIYAAERFLNQQNGVELIVIGKKGDDYFKKRRWPIFKRYLDLAGKTDFLQISEITKVLANTYRHGPFDAIYMAYTSYKSALSIRPEIIRLFPIFGTGPTRSASPTHEQEGQESAFLSQGSMFERPSEKPMGQRVKTYLEPSCEGILEKLLIAYVDSKVYTSLLEAFTAENSARMMAMKNATDNANEMIRHLTLLRNKARQGTITRELLDMVTACEALRG